MEVELSEKMALRMSQKEKERERRRMRDRQRRQSMSVEEREHHLARRRRNYQRRRQKADGSVVQQLEEDETSEQQEGLLIDNTLLVSEADEQVVYESKPPEVCLKIPSNISAMLPTRPRLTHVKHLARTFNDQAIVKHRVKAEVILKNGVSNCISAKTLRFNSIKRLARGLNHAVIESVEQIQQSEEGVQSLQCEESQQRISDKCQVAHINDDEGQNHQVTSDGNNELIQSLIVMICQQTLKHSEEKKKFSTRGLQQVAGLFNELL